MAVLSHKIPHPSWRATSTWALRPAMVAPLAGGLTLFGVGEGLLVAAHLGASPWTVFAQGIALRAHVSIGWSTLLISTAVLLFWIPFRERPGLGTIANILIISYVLNETVRFVPTPSAWWVRLGMIVLAVELAALGSALYLMTGLGPGPRDGLMTSIHRKFNVSVVYVRSAIELTVLTAGWLLGGTIGLGTAVFATTVGLLIGANLNLVARLARVPG